MLVHRGSRAIALAAGLSALLVVSACSSNLNGGSGSTTSPSNNTGTGAATFKVGLVTPETGQYAAFGEGDSWVTTQMQNYFNANPLQVGGQSVKVQVVLEDSQSSAQRAAAVADDLINNQHVNAILAQGSPDTVVAVDTQCEQNQVLCLSSVAPWEPWVQQMGDNPGDPSTAPKYSFHFFFGAADAGKVFVTMWNQLTTNKKVAALFPNDPDGQAFTNPKTGFPAALGPAGYKWDFPGLYTPGTQDFTAQITHFKNNGDQILVGLLPPPDFIVAWRQMQQQGFHPIIASVGKATEFPSAVAPLGKLAAGLTSAMWWTPSYNTTSSLTGLSSADFASQYTAATKNSWNPAMAYTESEFEVLAAALTKAGSTDTAALLTALQQVNINALVGPIDFADGPYPHVAHTSVAGGQWQTGSDGTLNLNIVNNKLFPTLPVQSAIQPMKYGS
jgi:branched-chain amino acid transport system substrate-binding protein